MLVSIVGTIGRVVKVPAQADGFNISRAVARIATGSQVLVDYLVLVLRSDSFQRMLVGESFETARKTLNLGVMEELGIPLPPRDVQKEIIAQVHATQRGHQDLFKHLGVLKRTFSSLSDFLLTVRTHQHVH